MALKTDKLDDGETHKVLAQLATDGGGITSANSIYVEIPEIGRTRRTDGGAENFGSGESVDYDKPVEEYKRGDHVYLTFEPIDRFNKHELTKVEGASVKNPQNVDEPTFYNSNIPKTCPQCGKKATAVVQSEYDTMTGGKVSKDADSCVVKEDGRGKWFELTGEHTFVH